MHDLPKKVVIFTFPVFPNPKNKAKLKMSNAIETLIEMGFTRERAELAVTKTGSQDVQAAMDWLLSHEEELDADQENTDAQEPNPLASGNSLQSISEAEADIPEASQAAIAKSIRCDDCGKLFKTNEEVQVHASKSGHENFSESTEEKKPLSEEEKKEQLAKIEAKLKQRRLEREAREKEEALLKEKARIKTGKELLEAKKKHEELEMKRIIEQRKREKEEERLAKQRVREQIEQDKLARKAKFGGATPETTQTTQPPAPQPVEKKPSQNYNEAKIQIRLMDGKSLIQNFGVKEPLSAVRLYVEMNRTDGEGQFRLMMLSYPRKIFTSEDYDKPLDSLGLVPTATLIVTKS